MDPLEESESLRRQKRDKTARCRMFDTPLMDFFSDIHPASPFIFWVPVLCALLGWTLFQGIALTTLLPMMALGALAWSLLEYFLHRVVFHAFGPRSWQRRFHFIFHGVHHDFPRDPKRLVMPLGVSIPVGIVVFLLIDMSLPRLVAAATIVGVGIGYLLYDYTHYFTHYFKARTPVGKYLKRHHLVHHHTGYEAKYGVTSPLWDIVFRTMDLGPAEPKKVAKAR